MTIKIVLPDTKGIKVGAGTKVYTDSGAEIHHISHMTIEVGPKQIITATLTVCVESIENLEGIAMFVPESELDKIREWGEAWACKQSSTATEG